MTDKLPPQLLALFAARPPLKYVPPSDHALEDRRTTKIDGIAAFLPALKEEYGDYQPTLSHLEKQTNARLGRQERQKKLVEVDFVEKYKPKEDKNIRGTGYETLFISRLSYNTTTEDLANHFKRYGRIDRIRIPTGTGENDKKHAGKPLGYAFIQFENEDDMKAAYKASEHLILNGRKVVVDFERGRTVRGWRPRRFGGGLGGRHYTQVRKEPVNRFNGPPSGPGFRGGGFGGGGFRGGFRGGRGGFDRGDRGDRGPRSGFAPSDAPMGPRSGFGGGRGGGGGGGVGSGGGGYRDRGGPNANYEPVQPRGNYRDRDGPPRDGPRRYDDDRRAPRGY